MAEIDWDKVIKAAQSKKAEEERKKDMQRRERDLGKRLDRMERLLEKAVDAKSEERDEGPFDKLGDSGDMPASRRKSKAVDSVKVKFHPEKLKSIGTKLSNSLGLNAKPKWSKGGKGKRGGPAVDFSDRRTLLVIIAIVAIVGGVYWMNSGGFNFDLSGLSGNHVTMYVCADGDTVVNDTIFCPTTTTTTTTSTTTTTTSTTTTTTTTLGAPHTIALETASCSGNMITATLKNAGTTSESVAYVRFFIDGVEATTFICAGGALAPGGTTACLSGIVADGSHDVEARGLVNVDSINVMCS